LSVFEAILIMMLSAYIARMTPPCNDPKTNNLLLTPLA